jgi:hypothetical protein
MPIRGPQPAGRAAIAVWLAATCAVAGCGSRRLYPVQGQVLFKDGTPLTGGWVVFEPLDPSVGASATGDIQSDGTFRLGTERKGDGAAEGRYRVFIHPPLGGTPAEGTAGPSVADPRYRALGSDPLEVEVKRNQAIILRLDRQ